MAGQTIAVGTDSWSSAVTGQQGLVLVDFWASWCGPCQMIAPIFEALAGEYAGKASFTKVDVDANQQLAMQYNVRSIPSILFFKDGKHVDTVVGLMPKNKLAEKINQHLG